MSGTTHRTHGTADKLGHLIVARPVGAGEVEHYSHRLPVGWGKARENRVRQELVRHPAAARDAVLPS